MIGTTSGLMPVKTKSHFDSNRDEEKEHAAMVLERVGRKDDSLDK